MKFIYHRQNIPLILIVSLAAVSALLFFTRKEDPLENEASQNRRAAADATSDQKLQKFSLTGFDEKGKKFWTLEGDAAKIDDTQTVYLEDHVTFKLEDDTVIRTDRVRWSQSGAVLRTDAMVYVNHENAKIRGRGAYGEPNKNFIQLNKDILMTVRPDTTITCTGPMKIYYNENKTVFYRNVRVVDQKGILTAKRMDVYFNERDRKLDKIIAIGDVVIERGTDTTHSERAIYTPATGSIRLEGSPKITVHKASSSFFNGAPGN